MSEPGPAASREISAKDVFARSNMPSRWERLTNVAPKTAPDRMYLAFIAARYRGDELLTHPDDLMPPDDFHVRERTLMVGWPSAALGVGLTLTGVATHLPVLTIVGIVVLVCAVVVVMGMVVVTQPAISDFRAQKALCEAAEARLFAAPMDSENTATLNEMITHDEGTLAYCAAKIASEIEQDPNWGSPQIDLTMIDLWDELTEVGDSARQIAEDRRATDSLQKSRLRNHADMKLTIAEDKRLRKEALSLLSARVYSFADYRDQVQRLSITARRDKNALTRAIRRVSDEQARHRLV